MMDTQTVVHFSKAVARSQGWDCDDYQGQPRITHCRVGPRYLQICTTTNCKHVKICLALLIYIRGEWGGVGGCKVQILDILSPGKACVKYLLHMLIGWPCCFIKPARFGLPIGCCTSLILP